MTRWSTCLPDATLCFGVDAQSASVQRNVCAASPTPGFPDPRAAAVRWRVWSDTCYNEKSRTNVVHSGSIL